jgi:hypothetical protein
MRVFRLVVVLTVALLTFLLFPSTFAPAVVQDEQPAVADARLPAHEVESGTLSH